MLSRAGAKKERKEREMGPDEWRIFYCHSLSSLFRLDGPLKLTLVTIATGRGERERGEKRMRGEEQKGGLQVLTDAFRAALYLVLLFKGGGEEDTA